MLYNFYLRQFYKKRIIKNFLGGRLYSLNFLWLAISVFFFENYADWDVII